MKPIRTMIWCAGAAGAVLALAQPCRAEAKANPYASIIDRNPFGLKDPPPPVKDVAPAPVVPPAKVVLTGITSLSTAKKCFLEITEQEPGKPNTVNRPILMEGERSGSIEVVSIDLQKNMVHIRNGGQEIDLKFEDASKSLASAAPRPMIPGMLNPAMQYNPNPGIPQPHSAGPAPTIITPGSADGSSRNSSVMVYGNQGTANTTAGAIPNVPAQFNNNIPPTLGSSETGARIIPSRPVRSAIPMPPAPGVPAYPNR
ncbi:MAG: hypothetical protein JWM16_4533 [Verrucomicrobiales bacterium]|nr:hypothetical protein [Verrucomicrobiales bacterium]